jgi:hypothetical protein
MQLVMLVFKYYPSVKDKKMGKLKKQRGLIVYCFYDIILLLQFGA